MSICVILMFSTFGITEGKSRVTLDVLLVLRVLRLVKIVGSVRRFKVIVHTISKIVPSLLTYGAVMMV